MVRLLRGRPDVSSDSSYTFDITEESDATHGKVNLFRIKWKKNTIPSIAEQVSLVQRLFSMKSTDFSKIEADGVFSLERRMPLGS